MSEVLGPLQAHRRLPCTWQEQQEVEGRCPSVQGGCGRQLVSASASGGAAPRSWYRGTGTMAWLQQWSELVPTCSGCRPGVLALPVRARCCEL